MATRPECGSSNSNSTEAKGGPEGAPAVYVALREHLPSTGMSTIRVVHPSVRIQLVSTSILWVAASNPRPRTLWARTENNTVQLWITSSSALAAYMWSWFIGELSSAVSS